MPVSFADKRIDFLGGNDKAGVQITRRNQVFRQLECKDADGTIPDNGIRGTADSKDRG